MKKLWIFLALLFASCSTLFSQGILKSAADTAFLMERVYFPQLQIRMSISFLTDDFSPGPKFQYTLRSVDSLERLIKAEPAKADYYHSLSSAHYYFHRDRAGDSLAKIAKDLYMNDMMKNPADTHAIRMLGSGFLGAGEGALAEAYYKELTRLAPASAAGWSGLAMVSMGNYQLDQAEDYFKKAMAAEPSNLENYCQMANLMMLKAIMDLNTIDSTVLDTLSYKSFVNTGFIEAALKKNPGHPVYSAMLDALHLTAMIYQAFIDNADKMNGHGDTLSFRIREKTRKDLLQIEMRMEDRVQKTFRDREFPYSCLMLIAFLENDPAKALQWFDKGVVYAPRSQNLYENITGICALGLQKKDAFRLQLKLDSIHPTVTNYLMTAYFYYLDKKFADAQAWCQKVLDREPKNFYALLGMAAVKTQCYRMDEASLYLESASKIDAKHTDVRFLNGLLFIFNNAPQMAKTVLNSLVSDYPGVEVNEVLQRFFP